MERDFLVTGLDCDDFLTTCCLGGWKLGLAAAADREISSVWAHGCRLCSHSLLGINVVFWCLLYPVLFLGCSELVSLDNQK